MSLADSGRPAAATDGATLLQPLSARTVAAPLATIAAFCGLDGPSLPAMLLSSEDGRPVYERMGFLPLLRLTFWHRARPG